MSEAPVSRQAPVDAPVHGILAEYDTPQALVHAAEKVKNARYTHWDCFTPFPIHGLEPAMGIRPTVLPWIVLGAGLTGLATATWMQWWMNAVDYPWITSGKPFWSLPANIPVMFELTVLFSAITALVAMLALNDLPRPAHPLDHVRRFARATDDRFFLLIEARDARYDEKATRELLEGTHPVWLDVVPEDRKTSDVLPRGVIYGIVIVTVLSLVPFALAARARATKSRDTRVHLIHDMDYQAKYKAQRENPLFDDGRAERPEVPGTVAVGFLRDDPHLYQGKVDGAWARTFPAEIAPTPENMARGKQQYEVFCAPCHGLGGRGDGMVHERAAALQQGTWVKPTDVHQDYLRRQPVGELFATIGNGIRNMPGYASLIEPEDRWRIVMYLRALQRSSAARVEDVPAAERGGLN